MSDDIKLNAVELAAELTAAWLSNQNNRVSSDEVPAFLKSMHATLVALEGAETGGGVSAGDDASGRNHEPAVSVRRSLSSKDHIISMIDGKPYRTLRRHLTTHGLTPEQYRERYNLKSDYPMVAPTYSEARREAAKRIGLGSKGRGARAAAPAGESAAAAAPKRRGRKPADQG